MCETCEMARGAPLHRLFCPACLHCGARLIQALRTLPRGNKEIKARQEAVLRDWTAHGHAQDALLELSRGPAAFADPPPSRRERGKT